MNAWGLSSDQTCEFCVSLIPSLLNIGSSVHEFFWSCWFPKSQSQNFTRAVLSVGCTAWTVCTQKEHRPKLWKDLHTCIWLTSTQLDILQTPEGGLCSTISTMLSSKFKLCHSGHSRLCWGGSTTSSKILVHIAENSSSLAVTDGIHWF